MMEASEHALLRIFMTLTILNFTESHREGLDNKEDAKRFHGRNPDLYSSENKNFHIQCEKLLSPCYSDFECILFGDCCHATFFKFLRDVNMENETDDYALYHRLTSERNTSWRENASSLFSDTQCLQLNQNTSIVVFESDKATCASRRRQNLCKNLLPAPVSVDSHEFPFQLVYKNFACAHCHGKHSRDLVPWNVTAYCNLERNLSNISQDFADSVLSEISNGTNQCLLRFALPSLRSRLRLCNKYFFSSFDSHHRGISETMNCFYCKHYISPVQHFGKYYKNEHCLKCKKIGKPQYVATSVCKNIGVDMPEAIVINSIPLSASAPIKQPMTLEYKFTYDLNMLFDVDVLGEIEDIAKQQLLNGNFNSSDKNASFFGYGNKYGYNFFEENWKKFAVKIVMNLDVFSITVVCISSVCLLILLILHVFAPKLRNFHGKTKISFSIALFFAQMSFLLGSIHTYGQTVCLLIAYSSHYFWLCSFCWSSVMAFDIATRFGFCLSFTHRLNVSKSNTRFVIYSLISWCCPLLIVAIAAVIDFMKDEGFLGYARFHVCWITDINGLMYGFAIPILGLITFNIICFISAAIGIEHHGCVLKKSTNLIKRRRIHCLAYARISLLLGTFWAFMFLAVGVDSDVLSFVSKAVNGLQGFFLLMSTICSRKGREFAKRKLSKFRTDSKFLSASN